MARLHRPVPHRRPRADLVPDDPDFTAGVVVPARTLADTAKAIRRGADVAIDLGGTADTLIGIAGGGRSMTSRLLDDQYINYRSRLTGTWTSVAEVRVAPFVEAIKRAALVTERGTPIRLAFTGGEVRLRAATGDSARANESLAADLTGDDIDIAFAPSTSWTASPASTPSTPASNARAPPRPPSSPPSPTRRTTSRSPPSPTPGTATSPCPSASPPERVSQARGGP